MLSLPRLEPLWDSMDVSRDCIHEPSMLIIIQVVWCHASQNGVFLLLVRNCAVTCFLQATCNEFTHVLALEVGAL